MVTLKDEIKQTREFSSKREEAILELLRTNDRIQIQTFRLLREYGLTEAQYNILRILRGAGAPLPCLEIANRMITVAPGITRLLDRLETAGLVKRTRSSKDRRIVHIEMTRAARSVLTHLDKPIKAINEKILGHMSNSELKQLIRLSRRARERCSSGVLV